ncbi:MAG: polysulfide reductase [Deltaproteobacteria bacterium]|nr:polysulfide reductase [Deltaproteobacteria bacterium]
MIDVLRDYLLFILRAVRLSFHGSRIYYTWMGLLTLLCVVALHSYARQIATGLALTGMTDQVSWGVYIANFTFVVGLAAAAVMLVIPAYIYKNEDLHNVVILGELLAIAAIIMCLLFVTVDLGRPDRFWHLMPGFGEFNFPYSLLAWDVVVLWGYLLLNMHICGYLLYAKYCGLEPKPMMYLPFVFIAIFWAICIHTVTAFLYVGLVGRPFWNTAIVAPRFIGSAFTAGPALMIIVFQVIRRYSRFHIRDEALQMLRQIVTVALLFNLFLFGCELFKEFYSDSVHTSAARYLLFGLHGHAMLVPWIWSAIAAEVAAALILILGARRIALLNIACVLAFVGIWIEKGLGLIVPGFLPTPLGEIVEYFPTLDETLICIGVWAFGLLLYSWMIHLSVPILSGDFRRAQEKPACPMPE